MKLGYYSPHFSRVEMIASDTAARRGILNLPPLWVQQNLQRLCLEVLEPIRAEFGPVRVTSGYRCIELNKLIGGSESSAHMRGQAADLQFPDPSISMKAVVEWLRTSGLPIDQVIFEFGAWVHVGIADIDKRPRHERLMIFAGSRYLPFNPDDPRVT